MSLSGNVNICQLGSGLEVVIGVDHAFLRLYCAWWSPSGRQALLSLHLDE